MRAADAFDQLGHSLLLVYDLSVLPADLAWLKQHSDFLAADEQTPPQTHDELTAIRKSALQITIAQPQHKHVFEPSIFAHG